MYYIGVDIGGTCVKLGLVDENGNILKKSEIPMSKNKAIEETIKEIALLCLNGSTEVGIENIVSIGVGSPGLCNNKTGVVSYSPNIAFNNTNIREEIQKYINLPVNLANDADCASIAEHKFGAGKGYKNSITITLGTGVGGGVIINDELYTGTNFNANELGHQVISVGGELCGCGRKGCFEAYASATALIRDAKKAFKNTDIKIKDAKTVFDLKDEGNEIAKKVLDNYYEYLSEGLANIINLYQPDVLAIGGGLSAQKDKLIKPLLKKLKNKVYGKNLITKVVVAELGNDAGIIGSAFLQ